MYAYLLIDARSKAVLSVHRTIEGVGAEVLGHGHTDLMIDQASDFDLEALEAALSVKPTAKLAPKGNLGPALLVERHLFGY